MKNLIYLSLIVLTAINVGCTAEPVTNQDDEAIFKETLAIDKEKVEAPGKKSGTNG